MASGLDSVLLFFYLYLQTYCCFAALLSFCTLYSLHLSRILFHYHKLKGFNGQSKPCLQQIRCKSLKMKRSKNIFNSPIIPQSLLDQQGHRQFQVGGLPVISGWLQNVPPQKYPRYIISALRLSELDKDLGEEKGEAIKNSEQTRKSNLFRIGTIKKKIDNFGLIEQEKEITLGELDTLKNQPPSTQDFKIHKISGGFFKSILQRKCKIDEKELYIQSQKEEKNPWVKLGIEKYVLQLESKEHSLNKQEFKEFLWPGQSTHRIILTGKEQKPYCIYGKEQQLKKLQRYFQVQSIEVKKQVGVFEKLDLQLRQKIITLFGNKVRFYDHSIKMRRAEKEMQYFSISKNSEMQDKQAKMQTAFKPIKQLDSDKGQSSQFGVGSEFGKSGLLDNQFDNKKEDIIKSNININSEIYLDGLKTPDKSRMQSNSEKKKSGSQIFKLRLKSSVIFYDQIEDPIHFDDQGSYSVTDLKLNLKEEVGISEVDQESQNKSVFSMKKQKIGKKVVHMSLKNAMDESQKFNINIHQASQNKNDSQPQKAQSQGSKSSNKKNPFSKYSLNLSQIGGLKVDRKQSSDSILDDFHLVRFDTDQNEQQRKAISPRTNKSAEQRRPKTLIRDFKKKRAGEIQIHENIRPQGPYFAIQSIQMFAPYHKQTINFEILQIDPNLQIHHKIVVCARATAEFKQKVGQKQRYIFYEFDEGFHFRISKQSDQFMFMLKQQGKMHYIRFTVDPNPKYQRNCSQLILGKLDQQGYPFSCSLNMYASPSPVKLKKTLTTIQFLHKYLVEGQNYQFKADFIDDKKRRFLVKREWNKEVVKNIVRNGDSEGFSKAIYLGLSDSIFKKIKKSLTYDPQRLFQFNQNQIRLMEQNISSAGIMDLRAFMKTSTLIRFILQSHKNDFFAQRLQHIYAYFLSRYGSTRNLALVFVKEVICKLQTIIVMGKKEQQIQAIIKLYFQIQYQIDDFFMEISKYFKK